MTRSRYLRVALFAAPGVALAVVGMTHPQTLSYTSSAHWTVMHVIGLFVFPLVGAALVGLVWRRTDPLALIIGVAAYLYATGYSALDVIAGIAAGYVTYRSGAGAPRPDEVRYLFDIGNQLGELGTWALVVAALAVGVDQLSRHRQRALIPALVLVAASISFLDSHIYPWRGVVTVLLIGLATGWLATLAGPEPAGRRPSER